MRRKKARDGFVLPYDVIENLRWPALAASLGLHEVGFHFLLVRLIKEAMRERVPGQLPSVEDLEGRLPLQGYPPPGTVRGLVNALLHAGFLVSYRGRLRVAEWRRFGMPRDIQKARAREAKQAYRQRVRQKKVNEARALNAGLPPLPTYIAAASNTGPVPGRRRGHESGQR